MEVFKFTIRSTSNERIPDFWGSALRGAFGHSLKKLVCINKQYACEDCYLFKVCTYQKIFDPKPSDDEQFGRKFSNLPPPFIIDLKSRGGLIKENQSLCFDLRILGNERQYTPFVIRAMCNALSNGIGKNEVKFIVEDIKNFYGESIFDKEGNISSSPIIDFFSNNLSDNVKIMVETPMRLLNQSKLMTVESWKPDVFIFAAIKRYAMIRHIYYGLETHNIGKMKQLCNNVEVSKTKLQWKDLSRYSSRQKEILKIGGLVGEFDLNFSKIPEFKPYIASLEYLGIGKGTSMGLGSVSIKEVI